MAGAHCTRPRRGPLVGSHGPRSRSRLVRTRGLLVGPGLSWSRGRVARVHWPAEKRGAAVVVVVLILVVIRRRGWRRRGCQEEREVVVEAGKERRKYRAVEIVSYPQY